MHPSAETWTIVVAGAWNVRVFSPDWVAQHLTPDVQLTLEVPVSPALGNLRIVAGKIVLIPGDDRLIVGVQEPTLEVMKSVEALVCRVLTMLQHTPVSAIGVNFGFEDDHPSSEITELFSLPDLASLSDFGCNVREATIGRSIQVDGMMLNLRHTLVAGIYRVHFNFHHDAKSAAGAAELLTGRSERCLSVARNLMSAVYHGKLDEAGHA